MKRDNGQLNLDEVNRITSYQKHYAEDFGKRARLFLDDAEKEKREKEQLCVFCYYVASWIGGAAMTEANCGICQKISMYGSTCVDKVCKDCADNHKLCVHCGADREHKKRRKL